MLILLVINCPTMARIVPLLLLLAGCCYAQRIMGGEDATIEQYPSVVQVEYYSVSEGTWSHSCGANILNNFYVLSAAHCFHPIFIDNFSSENIRIRAGATRRNSGGVVVNIVREFNHPSFLEKGMDGDISVVRLALPLSFGPTIQPASIPSQNSVVPDNIPVVYAGWGTIEFMGPFPEVLQHVQVYTVNHDDCRERYLERPYPFGPQRVTTNMICAGVLGVGDRDACSGDSGGPLFWNNITVGLVSFGHPYNTSEYPTVSTAVASYTDWVVQIASQ